MAATDRQIEQLRQQRELLGETAGRVAELTAKWQLLAEAKARGLDLDARQIDTGRTLREQIEEQARTIGELTTSYERAEERARFFEEQQSALKDGLIDAIVEGENFAGVLADVAKALAKAALQAALFGDGPFGGGSGGLLGGLFKGIFGGLFADGAAFQGGKVTPFARGGVVSRPTLFPMANGAGLMGEAGPEAIMPLRRIGGRLGVDASGAGSSVVVNVQTEPGLQGYAQETRRGGTREITVQVTRIVADDIQKGGETYRAMRRTFGLRPNLGGSS